MRQSLGVLAVLLGIVALTVAFVVFRRNFDAGGEEEDLGNKVSVMEKELASLRGQLAEAAGKNAALNQRLTAVERKLDADPAALAKAMFEEQLNDRIRKAVEAEMAARLKEAGAAPAASASSDRDVNFDVMVGGLCAVVGVDAALCGSIRSLCEGARSELNRIYADKKIGADRKKELMNKVRAELLEKIRKAVGEDKADRLEVWKKTVAHTYSRRFFGLDDGKENR